MKHHHPRPDLQRLLERRARHSLTFRELSEESGIPIPTLSYWASKGRRGEVSNVASAEFARVEVLDGESRGAISIEVGPSVRVMVESGFDKAHLARVLSVLAQC